MTAAWSSVAAAGSAAAAWVSARWAVAAARVASALAAIRLAAYAAGASILSIANNGRKALEAARMASIGLIAAFGLAAFAAARFDKAMSEVRAVTGGSARDMKRLSTAALEAGQATIYSATQAAKAEAELARAGISTADIIGGALKGSLDLAASGQLELSEAAIISAQAMNAFKLEGRDVGHIADVISAGAGKSATNVHDMGQAFRQAALLSSQTGLSLEDTVGTLSLFAQNALTGSDAGTSLKVMLQRLVPQSKEAARMMDTIGFSAYDAQGNFIGLSNLAGVMQRSFAGLTPEARNAAMATIFGSDAVRAATIIYEAGADGVDQWVSAVNDSGYATRVAATMTDNLYGDVERLAGALETALVSSGSSANLVLREMAQALTAVVNWYGNLNPAAQQTITLMAGVVGVVGLVGAGLLLLVPRIMLVRRELMAMGITAAGARGALLGLGKVGLVLAAMAAVGVGVQYLVRRFSDAPPSVSKLANSLVDFARKGRAAGELSRIFGTDLDGLGEAVQRIAHPTGMQRFNNAMDEIFTLGMADPIKLTEARDKVKSLDAALADLVSSGASAEAAEVFKIFAAEAEKGGTSAEKFRTLLPQYEDGLAAVDTQAQLAAGGQGALGDASLMTADAMAEERTQAEMLSDALNTLNGTAISAAQAEIGFQQSLADLSGAVRENGRSLDVTTEKGRNVKAALLDAAEGAMKHAEAVAEQTGSQEAGQAILEANIAALKRQMDEAGFGAKAIQSLTDAYAQIPEAAATQVTAPGADKVAADIAALREQVMGLPPGETIVISAPTKAAVASLREAGYAVEAIPGTKKVRVTAPTGTPVANAQALKAALDALRDKSITITTFRQEVFRRVQNQGGSNQAAKNAAEISNRAQGGPIHGPGTATSDSILVAASNGEFVIRTAAVQRYGPAFFAQLNAMQTPVLRRATGGPVGFSYTPTTAPALGGSRDPMDRYADLVGRLKDAWKEYSEASAELRKVRADKKASKKEKAAAEKKVRDEWADVVKLNTALGQSGGAKAPTTFNLDAYQKQLKLSLGATEKWRGNLEKIAKRGGQDVADMLASMGEEGYALVNSLAGASDKQFKDIINKLKQTGELAKATLADYTKQLDSHTKASQQFAQDLQTLASQGFGDLAQALAADGSAEAAQLASQAVGDRKAATAANTAVKKGNSGLSGEDLEDALTLLTTLRGGPGRGYRELIAAGLDVATIHALVPKMMGQIKSLPAENRDAFLKQAAGQGGVVGMARGGILTRPTAVLAAEAGDVESFIPWNGSARSRGLLAATASAMGYRLTPASRYGTAGGGGPATVREGDRTTNITLNGARQSSAEQATDLARHLAFAG
ncbi:phage tail tape measure protein [Streptomyces sp. CAU 1734]|uniref:phage tail tape measure protein n=1 Tax=Streptomyces sp. CAU 1734 TaxID=3140360 RepID=UPI0032601369